MIRVKISEVRRFQA